VTIGVQISPYTFPTHHLNDHEKKKEVRIITSGIGVFGIADCGGRPHQNPARLQVLLQRASTAGLSGAGILINGGVILLYKEERMKTPTSH
jgi:hypothetical protein